jgi:hypothetical protein
MRLQTNDPGMRVLGTLTGVAFLLLGIYAIFGEDDGSVAAAMRSRAFWFGVTTLVAGVWAIAVSWLEPDLSGVWCRQPRRLRGATSSRASKRRAA